MGLPCDFLLDSSNKKNLWWQYYSMTLIFSPKQKHLQFHHRHLIEPPRRADHMSERQDCQWEGSKSGLVQKVWAASSRCALMLWTWTQSCIWVQAPVLIRGNTVRLQAKKPSPLAGFCVRWIKPDVQCHCRQMLLSKLSSFAYFKRYHLTVLFIQLLKMHSQ